MCFVRAKGHPLALGSETTWHSQLWGTVYYTLLVGKCCASAWLECVGTEVCRLVGTRIHACTEFSIQNPHQKCVHAQNFMPINLQISINKSSSLKPGSPDPLPNRR